MTTVAEYQRVDGSGGVANLEQNIKRATLRRPAVRVFAIWERLDQSGCTLTLSTCVVREPPRPHRIWVGLARASSGLPAAARRCTAGSGWHSRC